MPLGLEGAESWWPAQANVERWPYRAPDRSAGAVEMADPVGDVVLVGCGGAGVGGQAQADRGLPAGVQRRPARVVIRRLPAHRLEERPGLYPLLRQELPQPVPPLGLQGLPSW